MIAALLAAPAPAQETNSDAPWIAIVRGDPAELDFAGTADIFHVGEEPQTIIPANVSSIDIGPDDTLFAIRDDDEGSELLRVELPDGDPEVIATPRDDTSYFGVSAAPDGGIAYQRFVPRPPPDPPEFLAPALEDLKSTFVPILVPSERPEGTTGVVTDADEDRYSLLFTNDPELERAHAEQINWSVSGSRDETFSEGFEPTPTTVRGNDGQFFCGASACFLEWIENDFRYAVGEFGTPEDAVTFAESLVPIEDLLGFAWQTPRDFSVPELVARSSTGGEQVLQTEKGFCECGYQPADWSADGAEVLAIFGAEGFHSQVLAYEASGTEEPQKLAETGEGGGQVVYDAGYGPDGVLIVESDDPGPPGTLRYLEGETIAESVWAFDVQGKTLAYVDGDGTVFLRDLSTGEEEQIADGAVDVSIGPVAGVEEEPEVATEPSADEGGLPIALIAGLAGAGILGLAIAVWYERRRRLRLPPGPPPQPPQPPPPPAPAA